MKTGIERKAFVNTLIRWVIGIVIVMAILGACGIGLRIATAKYYVPSINLKNSVYNIGWFDKIYDYIGNSKGAKIFGILSIIGISIFMFIEDYKSTVEKIRKINK